MVLKKGFLAFTYLLLFFFSDVRGPSAAQTASPSLWPGAGDDLPLLEQGDPAHLHAHNESYGLGNVVAPKSPPPMSLCAMCTVWLQPGDTKQVSRGVSSGAELLQVARSHLNIHQMVASPYSVV